MTTNDARRAVKTAITTCGGRPQTEGLATAFEALDRELVDGTAPDPLYMLEFDNSFMDGYFKPPFTTRQAVADAVFAAAGRPAGVPEPPEPTLDHMTAFYTLYLVEGESIRMN